MRTSLPRHFARHPTAFSSRFRLLARLSFSARLRHLRPVRTNKTAFQWIRSHKPRTPDGTLAQILRARAREAWRWRRRAAMTFVSARYAQLVKLCRARGCSREVAIEIVQEAHLRLLEYQRSAKVKDANSLLRRVALHLAINYYRRELTKILASESVDNLERRGMLIDPAAGPERTLAAEQELDNVVSLLSTMSERTCQIFIAQRSGYSYEEIATAFTVKARTIEKHVALAAQTLKETMPTSTGTPRYRPA